ncbi:MAG: NAD(P)/FAD-dependent oxidoreductase [Methanobacterium sp.]|nr:NAD(P)/FAD-dependent oxidoreductase [Methanobacterium sp.]
MKKYDIAVVGAGPGGCMAAIQGAQQGNKVILLEKNDIIGRKLLLTANGKCNLTNSSTLEVFLEKFGKNGSFYRDVFSEFSNQDLMNFFQKNGLKLKEKDDGRIFPFTEKSKSIVNVLLKVLEENNVDVNYNYCLKHLQKAFENFELRSTKNEVIIAQSVVIATGGVTYKFTGSTGDGFRIAKSVGHQVTDLKPGGVPLRVSEEWVHDLKGVTLENVGLSIGYGKKKKLLSSGNLLLTHFGVSGPVILDSSNTIVELMDVHGDIKLYIDFVPEIRPETLGVCLVEDFQKQSKKSLRTYLTNHLPKSMIDPLLNNISIDPKKKLNQVTKKERLNLLETLKSLPLTLSGYLPMDKAMITCGGVSQKEINPRTMESKLVGNLFFAGEIISGCGGRGGYNLQQAFSTGYVAGNSAAKILKNNKTM